MDIKIRFSFDMYYANILANSILSDKYVFYCSLSKSYINIKGLDYPWKNIWFDFEMDYSMEET